MYQQPFRKPRPGEEWVTKQVPPYTFGAHTLTSHTATVSPVFYYPAYNTIITQAPEKIQTEYQDPPAWLVADWLRARAQGIPISPFAENCLKHCASTPILQWFAQVQGLELAPLALP